MPTCFISVSIDQFFVLYHFFTQVLAAVNRSQHLPHIYISDNIIEICSYVDLHVGFLVGDGVHNRMLFFLENEWLDTGLLTS